MFLEFNCGHFGTKMESLRPSYQKLVFCPYLGMGVAEKVVPPSIWISNFFLVTIFDVYNTLMKESLSFSKVLRPWQKCIGLNSIFGENGH